MSLFVNNLINRIDTEAGKEKSLFRPIRPRAGLSGAGFRQTGSGYQGNRGQEIAIPKQSLRLPPIEYQVKVVRNLDCRQTSIAPYALNTTPSTELGKKDDKSPQHRGGGYIKSKKAKSKKTMEKSKMDYCAGMTECGIDSIRWQISRLRPAPIELRLTPNWCGASLEMTMVEIAV